jgi:peptidoglycan hydrolase-like protein with peptidoglycan-binding domain
MKPWTLLTAGALALSLGATPALAQSSTGSTAPAARANDKGRADIEQAQKALKEKGHYTGPVDGVMGPQTAAALKAYQKEQRLDVTGRLDDATVGKLGGSAPATTDASGQPRATGSQQSGGDSKPSAVDPAQAKKTGGNVGEGASYSRSTEKGLSK